MSIDLIAQVGQGADSLKIHALQRMLNNRWISGDEFTNKNNSIFEQKSYSKPLSGGHAGQPQRRQVQVGKNNSPDSANCERAECGPGSSNPVGMPIYDGKLIAYNAGGHSVIIVGCNAAATQFLYIDPWGGGSWMEYKGAFPTMRSLASARTSDYSR